MSVAHTTAPTGARVINIHAERERQFTSQVGMIVFLGSWAMMFGALFFAYAMLRVRSPAWPPDGVPHLPLLLPAINSGVMVASSLALILGLRALQRDRLDRLTTMLLLTLLGGCAFLVLQVVSWTELWGRGLTLGSRSYGAVFYTLTVFHGLHVLVGLGILAWLWRGARRGVFRAADASPVKVAAMFWHFVGVVWLVIFVSLYLV